MRAELRARLRPAGTLLAVLLLLLGCSEGASPGAGEDSTPTARSEPAPAPPAVASYVALGDSYTSAPLVPSTDLAEGCFRSDGNYPSLLAEELEAQRFVDVSCSGADTGDVTGPQATAGGRGRVPPQLRAVRPDTDLVTVGIGANDEGFFAGLATRCASSADAAQCTDAFLQQSAALLARTRGRVTEVLTKVQDKAPAATVALVGYPRLVAPGEPCPQVPVPPSLLDEVAETEVRLNRALRSAAAAAGVTYVDMHPASRGHEICSADPWINGQRTDDQAALAFHPFAAGQAAVAERVLEELRTGDS
jgi:lysophospholipase L1-like esterase